jgi:predicted PhzF superfamily epimerase YddE/YHI9
MRLWHVDAFTREPFAGNPAAVCLLDGPRDDRWMQGVAAEMKHSETAFLLPEGDAYRVRWFTPAAEVDLCGHATLASAHVLFGTKRGGLGGSAADLRFLTRSGELRASRRGELIELDFPALPPAEAPPPEGLLDALGATARSTHRSRFDRLVELESEDSVRALKPDFLALAKVDTRGVIVTARAGATAARGAPAGAGAARGSLAGTTAARGGLPETTAARDGLPDATTARGGFPDAAQALGCRRDFVSRFFAPRVGVDEDPVTGSAHCVLAPFWAARLGRTEMVGFQASRRGGEVRVRLEGDRVFLGGHAVTVLEGELRA